MKLLISLSYYSPYISGLTLSIKRLAELLAKNGYTVTILTSRHEKTLPRREDINKVSVVRVPYLLRISKGFVMPRFVYIAYKELHNADCVLIALPQVEGFIVALLLAKMLGKKSCVFIYLRSNSPEWVIGSTFVEFVMRNLTRITLSFADEITTLTDDFAKHNSVLKNRNVHGIYPIVNPPTIDATERNNVGA